MRKMREISACNQAPAGVGFLLRLSGQPSRLKPVGRIVEATRKFVRLGDQRPAGAANLWSGSVHRVAPVPGNAERGAWHDRAATGNGQPIWSSLPSWCEPWTPLPAPNT